ncbi:hypothetical protein Bcop_1314 [Bacteroides coprosuis DSM 18011]|uniref:DUF4286 domain-containing protein n=1 Tax=Bacteroides coprosuis DSM 18011 TaxID=679937 RepID=F3ZNT7_9BACE|nr:DUF4286 family protein [Bacteroides coprosuis]EGJ71513.1 hypothetical protein Bcop_1314 [Bacteroides coprosuis DSM 18011]
MLIYNTTYHVEEEVESNFLIWIKESFIPEVLKQDILKNPRICKILSHSEPGHSNFALQWEVDSPKALHQHQMQYGTFAQDEVNKIFKEKVLSFDTLMRVVE